jgi:hypothetical protein
LVTVTDARVEILDTDTAIEVGNPETVTFWSDGKLVTETASEVFPIVTLLVRVTA